MHIIGGGVIGLCSAWYLRKAGFDVTVIDRTDMRDGCSFGNAGVIVPSHSVPLAAPGVLTQGLKWMLNPRSPFYIRLQWDPDLLRWAWQFYRSSTIAHVEKATPILRDFHLLSKSLYQEFAATPGFAFDYKESGTQMLFRTQKGREEEMHLADRAQKLGLDVIPLTQDEVAERHPGMSCDILGGILYQDDAHLYPGKFILQMQEALEKSGVKFIRGRTITGFITSGSKITHLRFAGAPHEPVGEIVLAAGAWTAGLVKTLGLRLLMQDGKGYSVTMPDASPRPATPVILSEARVAITPMGNDLRIGGTLEVSRFSPGINPVRVKAILDATRQYYPDFNVDQYSALPAWYGFRPVTADGLPYIGRPEAYDNVLIAAGHAMLGMSLGPATGLLVSEIAQGKKASLPLEVFRVDRHR